MLTCETELVEVILPRDRTVCDAVYERAKDGTSASFVDAEDVRTASGRGGGVVRVGVGERRRRCGGDVHVSHKRVSRNEQGLK